MKKKYTLSGILNARIHSVKRDRNGVRRFTGSEIILHNKIPRRCDIVHNNNIMYIYFFSINLSLIVGIYSHSSEISR